LRYERDVAGETPTVDVLIADIDNQKVYGNSISLKDAHLTPGGLNIASQNFGLTSTDGKYNLRLTIPVKKTLLDVALTLTPLKKALLIGESGISQRGLIDMGNNTNSFYYAVTRLQTEGYIQIGNNKFIIESDPRLSRSWMDHQWGDFALAHKLKPKAWIWIGTQLKDGKDISIREVIEPTTDKPIKKKTMASISTKNGGSQYKPASIKPGRITVGGYPAYYNLKIGGVNYRLEPVVPHLSNDAVWVGILKVDGQSVKEPDASFAVVENMMPHL
jgi:predicted secreted hydrolase